MQSGSTPTLEEALDASSSFKNESENDISNSENKAPSSPATKTENINKEEQEQNQETENQIFTDPDNLPDELN